MLTLSFRERLFSRLKNKYINRFDFHINIGDTKDGNLSVIITYKYNLLYHFTVDQEDDYFYVTMSPGSVFSTERGEDLHEVEEIIDFLDKWVGNLEKEIELQSTIDDVNESYRSINDIEKGLSEYEDDSKFNSTEIEELTDKLNKLQEELSNKIKEDEKKESVLFEKIHNLENDIEFLKKQSVVLNKKNWLLLFSSRTYLWIKKHPKIATLIGTSAYQFIPDELKVKLPEEVVRVLLPTVKNSKE